MMRFISFALILLALQITACTSVTQTSPTNYTKDIKHKYPEIGLFTNGGHSVHSSCTARQCFSIEDRTPYFISREFINCHNFKRVKLFERDTDWRVNVHLRRSKEYLKGSLGVDLAATMLTLGVIPTTAKHEYQATIQIIHQGKLLNQLKYTQVVDSVHSVLVDIQAIESDAAMLLMAQFFADIEKKQLFANP